MKNSRLQIHSLPIDPHSFMNRRYFRCLVWFVRNASLWRTVCFQSPAGDFSFASFYESPFPQSTDIGLPTKFNCRRDFGVLTRFVTCTLSHLEYRLDKGTIEILDAVRTTAIVCRRWKVIKVWATRTILAFISNFKSFQQI